MKHFIAILALAFATTSFSAEPAKKETPKKEQTNCVTKDKKGNCPDAPKKTLT